MSSEHDAGDVVSVRKRLVALLEDHRNDRSLLLRLLVFVEAQAKPAPPPPASSQPAPEPPWLDVPPPPPPPAPKVEGVEPWQCPTPAEDLGADLMVKSARLSADARGNLPEWLLFVFKTLQTLNERLGALEPAKYGIPGVPLHNCVWIYGPGKCRGRCVNAIKAENAIKAAEKQPPKDVGHVGTSILKVLYCHRIKTLSNQNTPLSLSLISSLVLGSNNERATLIALDELKAEGLVEECPVFALQRQFRITGIGVRFVRNHPPPSPFAEVL